MQADPKRPVSSYVSNDVAWGPVDWESKDLRHLPPDFHWDTYMSQTFTSTVATKEH